MEAIKQKTKNKAFKSLLKQCIHRSNPPCLFESQHILFQTQESLKGSRSLVKAKFLFNIPFNLDLALLRTYI